MALLFISFFHSFFMSIVDAVKYFCFNYVFTYSFECHRQRSSTFPRPLAEACGTHDTTSVKYS